nr:hypothetical protein CFP56_30124 [Quercus suber]
MVLLVHLYPGGRTLESKLTTYETTSPERCAVRQAVGMVQLPWCNGNVTSQHRRTVTGYLEINTLILLSLDGWSRNLAQPKSAVAQAGKRPFTATVLHHGGWHSVYNDLDEGSGQVLHCKSSSDLRAGAA